MPNRKYDPMMGMSKGDDLPEGISMDETGVLEWEYVQNMWANPVHLYLLLKIYELSRHVNYFVSHIPMLLLLQ